MIRIDLKPTIVRLFRRVPMPLIAIMVGLIAGLAVWGVLEQVQSRQVKKIFGEELSTRLDLRSRESLIRFDQYLTSYGATVRLLANHRRLAGYLEPVFWTRREEIEPRSYQEFRPDWLPDFFERNALSPPSHVLLVDFDGRIREHYQAGVEPLPAELAGGVGDHLLDASEVRTVLTAFDDRVYLLVSDAVEDLGGFAMGSLVVLVPVDERFLAASQRGLSAEDTAVALVDSEEQRILVTIDPRRLVSDTPVSQWTEAYLVTSRSLPYYEGSDLNLLFTTFVSHVGVEKMSRHVRHFEWRQRGIAAVVFVGVFTLVIYLVSSRLNKVLRRMSRFSHRALGIAEPGFSRGANQLILLEDWIGEFTQLVLKAREEMSRRHAMESEEAERQIESLARFAAESPNPILRVNQAGSLVYANPASKGLLASWARDSDGALPTDWQTEVTAALAGGLQCEREQEIGGQIYSLLFAPIRELGYVNIYARDITAVRRAEQEARQHQAELVHVCRLSTMGEVATGMAHELNQPLSAIANYASGSSRRLRSGIGDDGELVAAMDQIGMQAQRAGEIIRRLRALVGKQPPSRTRTDLNHLVREVCSFVEFETGKMGLTIGLELGASEIPVYVDLVQIEQVLLNLLRNALDALDEMPATQRRLIIGARIDGAWAEVWLEDNGSGIPPERMKRLFDPFFTTKATGMGMGLPISQTILHNHQGEIWADSGPGVTVFYVRLPLASGQPTAASSA